MSIVGDDSRSITRPSKPGNLQTSLLRLQQVLARFDRRRVLALVLSGLVAVVVSQSLGRARATVTELGPGRPTLVATASISAGTQLSDNNTNLAEWPEAFRPAGAVDSSVLGLTATVPLAPGQAVSIDHLRADRHGLDRGERAVTIPMPPAAPPLAIGDSVEVVGLEALADGLVTAQVLTRAGVVELSEDTITLAVGTAVAPIVLTFVSVGGIEVLRLPSG